MHKRRNAVAELLIELFSEEIPARMQTGAAAALARRVEDALKTANLAFELVETFVTPRRLALVVQGLPQGQPEIVEERKGPRVGAPEAAVNGFLKAAGLASLEQAEQRESGKGRFYFAAVHKPGRPTAAVLADILPAALASLPWPKSMRWGSHDFRWVRPLRRVVCIFDGKVVPFPLGPVTAGAETQGHRFLAPASFAVIGFDDYRDKLKQAFVVLDARQRRAAVEAEARAAAEAEGLRWVEDPALLEEVAGLVEWPVVLMGSFDKPFLDLPEEVLATAMRVHQKYFPLRQQNGSFAPRFLLIANQVAPDGGREIVAGNERVLRARLSDARFFWDQDRKATLASRLPALQHVVFHARLGTLAEKTRRISGLAAEIGGLLGADPNLCERAGELAKADLSTGMVGEFPELQGVIGGYYARNDREPEDVVQAIAEHYAPLGPSDRCPTAPVSIALALADKIDTLVGFFTIGERPTGSKDPFALRRAAQGVIRLILENALRLRLLRLFASAYQRYDMVMGDDPSMALLDFFADRLKVHLREQGVRHDLVAAVFAQGKGREAEDDLVRLRARVAALQDFLATEDGANLLVAYRRAANILRIEEKKDGRAYDGAPDAKLLTQAEEWTLFARLSEVAAPANAALKAEEFTAAGRVLAALRQPVDAFFDGVTVNAEADDLRANRLRLLAGIRGELDVLADFSRIEG
jgi:glycyl-tRNA synthetase beta chain